MNIKSFFKLFGPTFEVHYKIHYISCLNGSGLIKLINDYFYDIKNS
ncbi:hypothetical protein [Mycoplasmopsis arginini]|nr:hypothetical protein [Mycoplasmopsis arginini]